MLRSLPEMFVWERSWIALKICCLWGQGDNQWNRKTHPKTRGGTTKEQTKAFSFDNKRLTGCSHNTRSTAGRGNRRLDNELSYAKTGKTYDALESGVKLSDDMRKICFSSSFDLNKKISLLPTWRLATMSRSSAAPRYTAAHNAADPDTQALAVLATGSTSTSSDTKYRTNNSTSTDSTTS